MTLFHQLVLALLAIGVTGQRQTVAVAPARPELQVQIGHTRVITTLVVSDDGRLIATANGSSGDGTIKLWEADTGFGVRTFAVAGAQGVVGVAISHNSRLLASSHDEDGIRLWDVASGRLIRTFKAYTYAALEFSADGRYLIAGAQVWNVATGQRVVDATPPLSHSNDQPDFYSKSQVSPAGDIIALGTENRPIALRSLATGRVLPGLDGAVGPFVFSRDGRAIATKMPDGGVAIWNVATRRRQTLLAPTRMIPIGFLPSGRELVTAETNRDGILSVWNALTGQQIRQLTLPDAFMCRSCTLRISRDGKWLAEDFGSVPRLSIWSLEHPEQPSINRTDLLSPVFNPRSDRLYAADRGRIWSIALDTKAAESCFSSSIAAVHAVALSSEPAWFATYSLSGLVAAWDARASVPVRLSENQAGRTATLSALSKGSPPYQAREAVSWIPGISSGNPNEPVIEWKPPACGIPDAAGDVPLRADGPWNAAPPAPFRIGSEYPIAITANGQWAAEGVDEEPWINVWNPATGTAIRTLDASPIGRSGDGVVTALAATVDGAEFVSATSIDSAITVWNARTLSRTATLLGHTDRVRALAYDPVSGGLASSGWDKTVRLWNTAAKRQVAQWTVPGSPDGMAFRPDGKRLALVIGDHILECDLNGTTIRRYVGHTAPVTVVLYTADGTMLLTGSRDGSTRLWDAKTGALLATVLSFNEPGKWLVVTPEGYFDGPQEAWPQILWRFNNNSFDVAPVETFYREFYRQDLIKELLAGKRPPPRVTIARIDRRQPTVAVAVPAAAGAAQGISARRVPVTVTVQEAPGDATHKRGSGVRDVRLFRNGSLIHVWHGEVVLDAHGRATLPPFEATVIAGENRFSAYAFSRADIKSRDAETVVTGTAPSRRGVAWILAVGINSYLDPNWKLNLAIGDAQGFAAEFADAQTKLGRYDPRSVSLLDRDATKANLMLALDILAGRRSAPDDALLELKKLNRAEPEDTVVIFFAGHGTADGARFYLIPRDVTYLGSHDELGDDKFHQMLTGSISDRELAAAMEPIDARDIVLLIDACRSGQALQSDDPRQGPMNSPGLAQLAYEKGMYILTAAQAYQNAIEGEKTGGRRAHGLLTQALLDALSTSPARSGMAVRQWLDTASTAVPRLFRALKQSRQEPFIEEQVQRPRVFYRRIPERIPFIVVPGSGS